LLNVSMKETFSLVMGLAFLTSLEVVAFLITIINFHIRVDKIELYVKSYYLSTGICKIK
jgi:hypothetical protein